MIAEDEEQIEQWETRFMNQVWRAKYGGKKEDDDERA